MNNLDYEGIVIGSGFGGSINACRLSKKWPGKILLVERGKRYPMGSFPRKPHDMAKNFWNTSFEKIKRPKSIRKMNSHGLFDIRSYRHMDAVLAAGYGGGSLIYANVFMEAPDAVFKSSRWPKTCQKEKLAPYYALTKSILGARKIPDPKLDGRNIIRTKFFQDVAKELGYKSTLADINVFFGNDFDEPLPKGVQEKNQFGAIQSSCTYCGECDVGCNTHSKNTLDLNYLFVAEKKYGLNTLTEHLVQKICPLDEDGELQPEADGSNGYRVYIWDLKDNKQASFTTARVVVSAGTLGTNELLLRSKKVFKTLPRISAQLGSNFSGNGDFLSFILGSERPVDPNFGPVITQYTDHHLFKNHDPEKAFILEDASYPSHLAWFVEGEKPEFFKLEAIANTMKAFIQRFIKGRSLGRVGFAFENMLKEDLSYHTCVNLCMGLDNSDGSLKLDRKGHIKIDWPYWESLELYGSILKLGTKMKHLVKADAFLPLPTWFMPMRKNITVHPLGGCAVAESSSQGVCHADTKDFGKVYGYENLFVADGSIVPTAVGANPSATISAMSEMVAHGITGLKPTKNL